MTALHANYFVFQADNNFELGLQLGAHSKSQVQTKMSSIVRDEAWAIKLVRAEKYHAAAKEYFPQSIREVEGYAKGAGVDFLEFWTRSLEDEFVYYRENHCTSIITNGGKLISHNEDWAKEAADEICVIQKTIGDVTILELNYFATLGGNSASVNSYGYTHLVNTLTHSDWRLGVPRNVIARFMSETKDPVEDFEKLKAVPRSTGYNHNIVGRSCKIWNIESTAEEQYLIEPSSPFVHTNHYLIEQLKPFEAESGQSTVRRYDVATEKVKPKMTDRELMGLTSDSSEGSDLSIFNERTIARMVVDLEQLVAKIWLLREADRGWVDYPLDFIK
jgi:hypothetical protein